MRSEASLCWLFLVAAIASFANVSCRKASLAAPAHSTNTLPHQIEIMVYSTYSQIIKSRCCLLRDFPCSQVDVRTQAELIRALNDETVKHIMLAEPKWNITDLNFPKHAVTIRSRNVILEGMALADGRQVYLDVSKATYCKLFCPSIS